MAKSSIVTKKDLFDSVSMRCISQLESFEDVCTIDFLYSEGLSSHDFAIWEKRNSPYKLPDDFKGFYTLFNGISVMWKVMIGEKPTQIGNMSLNKIEDIKRVTVEGSFIECEWKGSKIPVPNPKTSVAFAIDSFTETGQIVFLFREVCTGQASEYDNPSVWLIDISLRWHYICASFSDYMRLMILHLGIFEWQHAFTPEGLSMTTQLWMGIFAKERLCTNLYQKL